MALRNANLKRENARSLICVLARTFLLPNEKGPPEGDPFANIQPKAYSFTLSFSAFAMVILTTLSASFLNCSPVAGLRTIRSGRSRQ